MWEPCKLRSQNEQFLDTEGGNKTSVFQGVQTDMKILLFAEEYPPHGSGVASSAKRMGQGLSSLWHDVIVLTYDRLPIDGLDPRAEITTDGAARVLSVGPYMRFPKRAKSPKLNDSTKAILRRRFIETVEWKLREIDFVPDLIISLYLTDAGYISCFLANIFECPHIAGVRGNDIGLNLFDPPKLPLTSFVIERADAIAYVNTFLHRLGTTTFPETKARSYVTNNSIAPLVGFKGNARSALQKLTGWADEDRIFAYVGLFREKKGCVEIVNAFTRIHETDPDHPAKLLLISPPLSKLENEAVGHRLNHLIAEGRALQISNVPREEVLQHISGADFLLMPSRSDGMANALLEGMACGLCPVVSSIFTDVVEHGENGLVLESVSTDSLMHAINLGSTRSFNAKKMGEQARESVAMRSPEDEAREYLAIYDELRGEGKAVPATKRASASQLGRAIR